MLTLRLRVVYQQITDHPIQSSSAPGTVGKAGLNSVLYHEFSSRSWTGRALQGPSEPSAELLFLQEGDDRRQVLNALDAGRFDEARQMVLTPVVRKKIRWYCEQERKKVPNL